MKTFLNKVISLLVISSFAVNSAQASKLLCGNQKIFLMVEYGQSSEPLGGTNFDKVTVETMDGSEFSFTTKLITSAFNTRCGTELHQSAGLYTNWPKKSFGYLDIKKFGEFCTGQVVAKIHMQNIEGTIEESLNCHVEFQ